MSYIEFNNVVKRYGSGAAEIRALDGASFSVEKGELAVILGASGAGKTTALNILGGMDSATGGSVLIDGQCPFYDFLAFFGAENAVPRNAYNTISGLVLDQLKHIPATGEKLRWNSFDLEIVDMDGVRIDKILVTHDQAGES